jgi:hypothetical protein
MVLFKINGERNSGTNFIAQILLKNNFPTYVHEYNDNTCKLWKHGIPTEDIKLLDDEVIDIFIFRELEEWLVSMYHNVYQLKKFDNFISFLTLNQESTEEVIDYKTNKCLNEDDNNKTIFEIRYYKFKKILEYRENNKFIILVNLKFLQNKKNLIYFLEQLNNKYMNNSINNNYITEIPHTKTLVSNSVNQKYNIELDNYKDIINAHKNEEIETFINNITFNIK